LLRIADEEAEHLRGLIDDAVEMARLDSANIEVHLEPSSLGEIVREVVASMRKEFDARPVEVIPSEGQTAIRVDQRLLRLAIRQLLDNALKYTAPGTPVTIAVREAEGGMTVEVADRGKGIPLPEQTRLFDRFWRSPSVKKQVPGSGLGLSIAHAIARAHKGQLTVASRPGETTFRLTLPADQKGEQS
jgi:signal transduction histidine kinase